MIYTHEYPYHITARTNNKERYPLPLDDMWTIYCSYLNKLICKYKFRVYCFVMMKNHYHMLASFDPRFPIYRIMAEFQTSVSRTVNSVSGKINHLYGGPYFGSLITTPEYFYIAYKYILQNPVRSGAVKNVEQYSWSTLKNKTIYLSQECTVLSHLVPREQGELLMYLNETYSNDEVTELRRATLKPKFNFDFRIKKEVRKKLLL